jgi:hypothetical protein
MTFCNIYKISGVVKIYDSVSYEWIVSMTMGMASASRTGNK